MVDAPEDWELVESSENEPPVSDHEEHTEKYRRGDDATVAVLEVEKEKSGEWGYVVRAEPTPAFEGLERPDLGTYDDLETARERATSFMTDHPA